jgi:hypothetical protein
VPEFSQPAAELHKFQASFDSDCENCPDEIQEGDMIAYLPGDSRPSCPECVAEFGEDA